MATTHELTRAPANVAVDVLHTEDRDGEHWEYRSNGDIAVYLPMQMCSRSFTAMYGGKQVTITAGMSRLHSDHDLVRAYPHHFADASAAPVRARSTTTSAPVAPKVEAELRARRERLAQLRASTIAADTPRTGPSRWFLRDEEPSAGWTYENCGVELRSKTGRGGSPLSVRLGRDAWDEIRSQAQHYQEDLGVECFGALYAPVTHRTSRGFVVTEATEIGLERSHGSVHARLEDLHANERKRRDGDIRAVGSWHTQPNSVNPSPADLATWRHAHMHAHSRHRAWRQVHLIIGPDKERTERRWRHPEIAAYTLRREEDSLGYRYLCEPTTVILPG